MEAVQVSKAVEDNFKKRLESVLRLIQSLSLIHI